MMKEGGKKVHKNIIQVHEYDGFYFFSTRRAVKSSLGLGVCIFSFSQPYFEGGGDAAREMIGEWLGGWWNSQN